MLRMSGFVGEKMFGAAVLVIRTLGEDVVLRNVETARTGRGVLFGGLSAPGQAADVGAERHCPARC